MGEISLKRLWVLMITSFVNTLGFALILPLLPLYAKDFGASPFVIGLLLASFALAQLVTAPLWGRLSDRVGRRPVIVGGQALSALAFVFFAMADSVWLLLLSRLAQGAGGGTVSANHAYVSDAVQPTQRAQALGWITAATSAGVMIGPAIGSLSLAWTGSEAAPGLISAGFCVLNLLFAWRWLPESTTRAAGEAPRRRPPILESVAAVARRPGRPTHGLIWVYASGMLAFMSANSVIALYLSDRFAVAKEEVGYFYVAMGFVSVVMRALILGYLVRLLGELKIMRLGALAIAAGLALPPLAPSPIIFLLSVLFVPTGTALLFPATTSLISRCADPGQTGQVLGVQQAFGSASRLLAPIWAGAAYQALPPAAAVAGGGALPFWISAGIVMLTLLMALRLRLGQA